MEIGTAILCQYGENATKVNLSQTFEPINWLHLLGNDDYGIIYLPNYYRCMFNIVCYCFNIIVIVVIGVTLGLFAGYKKGGLND